MEVESGRSSEWTSSSRHSSIPPSSAKHSRVLLGGSDLTLKVISNRGTAVWPDTAHGTSLVDAYQCRFVIAGAVEAEVTDAQILESSSADLVEVSLGAHREASALRRKGRIQQGAGRALSWYRARHTRLDAACALHGL